MTLRHTAKSMQPTAAHVGAAILVFAVFALFSKHVLSEEPSKGTVHFRAFDLPLSNLINETTRSAVAEPSAEIKSMSVACAVIPNEPFKDAAQERACYAPLVAAWKARYSVLIEPATLGGVATEIFTPSEGAAATHQKQILINLHGGAFVFGAPWGGQIESIPVAAIGKYKVISVEYRLAPQYQFPAASEDVEAVYRELLKTYESQNIGIFGCSAGGVLTAQVTAWLQWKKLPTPGAIAMLCGAGTFSGDGDSGRVSLAQTQDSSDVLDSHRNPYLKDVDVYDSLAYPARSPEVLSRFPPSLLITASRDFALSSVVFTHSRLVSLGVDAELHVWEGLGHQFMANPELLESGEVYAVLTKFFDRHLSQSAIARTAPETSLEASLKSDVDRFVEADAIAPPTPCQILFVGSSSLVKWQTLDSDMSPLPVLNRGFGGSHIEYIDRWFDQVVTRYHPRAIVFYAGENDLAAGKSVERVVADFDEFMAKKTAALGNTPVYFISIKPSPLRWWQFELQSDVNASVRKRASRRRDLYYIDVVPAMLANGKPGVLYTADHLHMTPEGYAIWTGAVRAALLPKFRRATSRCQ